MVRLVTRGRFTQDYAKGLVAAPEDREPAVKKLIESVGAKLINFYFTTGDSDFLIVTEGDDAESIIAALLATAGAGTISDISTARAWTGKEFKAVAEKASKAAKAYKAPGKHWKNSGSLVLQPRLRSGLLFAALAGEAIGRSFD
jgi:uncharacterized protein with GYD domain